jgi:hypothetical protein
MSKIPSLVQIFMAEFFGVMFLSVPISKTYERLHPPAGYQSLPLGKADYIEADADQNSVVEEILWDGKAFATPALGFGITPKAGNEREFSD